MEKKELTKCPIEVRKRRLYKLTRNRAPISFEVSNRHKRTKPLYYFDENTGQSRPIRYATNKLTPFIDEQDGDVVMGTIEFKDGMLSVPENNVLLQWYLSIHPDFGNKFVEVDKEKDAQKELESLELTGQAVTLAMSLKGDMLETAIRVVLQMNPDSMTTPEMKRDILKYAQREPVDFLNTMSKSTVTVEAETKKYFDRGILQFRNQNKEVWYKVEDKWKKLTTLKYGVEKFKALMQFFETDEGKDAKAFLDENI